MKKSKRIFGAVLAVGAACVIAAAGLTGCGGGLSAPENFTFDRATRAFSFDASGGAESYQIVINKIINEATGKSLSEEHRASIQREEKGSIITQYADIAAVQTTMPGSSESVYMWTPIISSMLVQDNDHDGKVSGNLSIFKFQLQSDGVTPELLPGDPEGLPLGHYYISCYASDAEGNSSEAAWREFVVEGRLDAPDFSYSVEDGKMTITLDNTYINNAMLYGGMPYSVDFTIDDGSGSVKTVSFDDWSYYATVIGPATTYNYMFLEKEIDVADAGSYTVTAVAKGDGAGIEDSETVTVRGINADTFTIDTAAETSTFTAGGTTYTLTKKEASGENAPIFRWSISGGELTSGTLEYKKSQGGGSKGPGGPPGDPGGSKGPGGGGSSYSMSMTTTSASGSATYTLSHSVGEGEDVENPAHITVTIDSVSA